MLYSTHINARTPRTWRAFTWSTQACTQVRADMEVRCAQLGKRSLCTQTVLALVCIHVCAEGVHTHTHPCAFACARMRMYATSQCVWLCRLALVCAQPTLASLSLSEPSARRTNTTRSRLGSSSTSKSLASRTCVHACMLPGLKAACVRKVDTRGIRRVHDVYICATCVYAGICACVSV